MGLFDFLGKQVPQQVLVVRERHEEGKASIRLKCSKKRLFQELNIPEKGVVTVHMKTYDFDARYDVSGSSFRVNLGTAFAPLLYDEDRKIVVVFKLFNGVFEMFYKENEEPLYPPQISRPDYGKEFYFCSACGKAYYKADKCPNCGIATRKRSRKNNGDKPRVNLDYDGDGE